MAARKLPWWRPTAKTWLHIALALPLAVLIARAATSYYGYDILPDLGANPIEKIIRNLGDWALRFLLVALAVTPARRLTGRPPRCPLAIVVSNTPPRRLRKPSSNSRAAG